jgi:hypothetical protein
VGVFGCFLGFLGGFVGFFLWVCFGFLIVNPFSLFHFSIKLLITYQKKKSKKKKKYTDLSKKKKNQCFFSIHVESLPEISILLCFDELSPLPKRFKLGLVYTRRLLTLPLPEIDPSFETVPTTSPQIDPPSETISQSSP